MSLSIFLTHSISFLFMSLFQIDALVMLQFELTLSSSDSLQVMEYPTRYEIAFESNENGLSFQHLEHKIHTLP